MSFPTNAIEGATHSWNGRQWQYREGRWRSVTMSVGRAEFEELAGRVSRELRIAVEGGYLYVGRAAAGVEEGNVGWQIKRSSVDASGVVGASLQGTGAWTSRQSLTYEL